MTRPQDLADGKPSVGVVEDREASNEKGPMTTKNIALEASAKGQGVSGYERLTLWETVMKFKLSSLVCFAVTITAGADGYQIGFVAPLDTHPVHGMFIAPNNVLG